MSKKPDSETGDLHRQLLSGFSFEGVWLQPRLQTVCQRRWAATNLCLRAILAQRYAKVHSALTGIILSLPASSSWPHDARTVVRVHADHVQHKQPELTPEERDKDIAETLAEVILDVIEICIKEGRWNPETGLVGMKDTLEETWIHPNKKEIWFESPEVPRE